MLIKDIPFILLASCTILLIGTTYIYFLFRMGGDSGDELVQEKVRGIVTEVTRRELGRVVDTWVIERKEDAEQKREIIETIHDLKKLLKQQGDEIKKLKGSKAKQEPLKWEKLKTLPKSVIDEVERISDKLAPRPKLQRTFKKCFVNTLETTTEILNDGTTHVITGDIPAMWLRDSSAQVHHYIPLAKEDEDLQKIIEGLIARQAKLIQLDPYANAYRLEEFTALTASDKQDGKTEKIWERKYEVDSLAYFLSLSYKYWKETGSRMIFTDDWLESAKLIVATWVKEQRHSPETSPYKFHSEMHGGKGRPTKATGMTWSGFRPSDDACQYNFLIPSNMFAVVVLKQLAKIAAEVYHDEALRDAADTLAFDIDKGIHEYGVVEHPKHGKIYAYETDGLGNHNLMDDANVPSLLSIPYLGYTSKHDPNREIEHNTRKFVLSSDNPFYFSGRKASGIGSPHTWRRYIWHIALIMQALTSTDTEEINKMVDLCLETDAGREFMHESFDVDDPNRFTRSWFAWANSLFGELVRTKLNVIDLSPAKNKK